MDDNSKKMTFFQHLEELRILLVRCSLLLVLGCIIVGCFFPFFASLLNYPLNKAFSSSQHVTQGLVTTSPMGIFSVLIQVCILGGLAISLPFMLYCIARYLSPGLKQEEKRLIAPTCIAVLALFFVGASFSYFFVIPASLSVAISLNETFGFQLIWSAPHYYGMVVWMTLGIGMCFEFPLALLLLMYLRILSSSKLRKIRRHMIVAVLIVAALITPSGDPYSLAILAVPLYMLYEIAIIIGARYEKKEEVTPEILPWPLED